MPEELGMFWWIFTGRICGTHELSVCRGGRKLSWVDLGQ